MYGIPEPCSSPFHRSASLQENNPSFCLHFVWLPADRQISYNPVLSLRPMCLPGFPIPPLFFTSLLLLFGQGKVYSRKPESAKHLNPDEVKLHPYCLATLCLSRSSRHIACSGVSLKSRLWPKLRCTLTRGSIGLDPKLPLTSREKNLKRIPT